MEGSIFGYLGHSAYSHCGEHSYYGLNYHIAVYS